jgi:hypothetical protein
MVINSFNRAINKNQEALPRPNPDQFKQIDSPENPAPMLFHALQNQ